jgi:hypothetical protein
MEKKSTKNTSGPALNPILFDKLKLVKNGYLSIVKQDGKIIQINICDRITTGPEYIAGSKPPQGSPA